MAHPLQVEFCKSIKKKYPEYFKNVDVLDVGSVDINGNNRYLFSKYTYTGLDVGEGNNVDVICPIHLFKPNKQYDVIISTEMLEHDKFYVQSLQKMFDLLKPNGLLLLTAAGDGRLEHGTKRTSPEDSPYTTDYYKNINWKDILGTLSPDVNFIEYELSYKPFDIRFAGIKK